MTETIEIFSSRPASPREPREERCYDLLESLGVAFTRADHAPAETMEACEAVEAALDVTICKNLFLTNSKRDRLYLLVMPGGKQLVTRELSKKIGSTRLSFATPENMLEYLDVTPGSVSILGLMNDSDLDVTLLFDRELISLEYFGCHPCKNTSTLKFSTADLTEKLIPALKHQPTYVEL